MHKEYHRIIPDADTAILMVHGIAGTPRHFDFLLEAIPENVSVCNILLPGHGSTVLDFGASAMTRWKEKVETHMAELCRTHRRVIVVAHSMGTLLTTEAAPKHPKVESFLLINVPLRVWVAPRLIPSALRWCFHRLIPGHPTDEGLKVAASPTPDKHLWRYLSWVPRFWELLVLCKQSRKRLETLDKPTFAFQSYDDELVRRSTEKHLLKNTAIRCIMLEGCGHLSYPPQAQAQMRAALQELLK